MSPQPQKPKSKVTAQAQRPRPNIQLKRKNWILMGAGVLTIVVGYIFLSKGSITIAPILLVAGYCVLIPISILVK